MNPRPALSSGFGLPPLPPGVRRALLAAAFVAGYVALDWLSYIHPMQQYGITPWNPQPALAIALLALGGQRWLPAVFLAAVLAEWGVRDAHAGWAATLVIGAVLALCYAAIARALTGRFAVRPALDSRRDAIRLVAVISGGALVTGVLYIAALLASGVGPLERPFAALMRFWIGDAVGVLVTLPILMMLSRPERRAELAGMLRRREMIAYAAATGAAVALVFLSPEAEQVKLFYVLFLPLILVATRYGMAGASVAAIVVQGAVIATGELAGYQAFTVFEFQALLIALTVTGLFLGVTVDERRRAEAELRRTLRLAAAGEMAAALAHELNQPLTAVATYARAARMIAEAPAADRALLLDTLGKLVSESTRASEVVRRLRDFFRSGTTRLAPVALAAIAARVLEAARTRADALGITLALEADPDLPEILADETQLEVVLRNLVANAIDAASAARPGKISVRVAPDGPGLLRACVSDSGPGVAEADAGRIFEPFETTRASGMGIGLAVSRAIVEAHGGRLWVEPGTHGVFCFTLPREAGGHG
jgi:signal transduction histidine kinase